ncbi:fumarylacetoacetate (FAA) hydrolase [Sulfolobus islandicus Y.G.57.14]|jgi:2-keto-4-pentenoate hydratase/2-oxohepta-3-ene-1,7-dioic acid hydratase in catechol pathway|uniref:Fumarylacetoacetate (FAA) hydrolase n=1 Tax=Saccharolobus islandicus (strain Y.G.57.14 / Yellowstone \|nr:fumarylacetoacetate hydrolase family protein [Sulfolobus islandicus]ACP44604.1 fumarylacetoacetate (FAA) hydrolase [Sulfolobus islandicus Y.G.57.14]
MKLLSFIKDNRVRSGVLVNDEHVADLNTSCYLMLMEKGEDEQFVERYCQAIVPPDMLSVLQAGDRGLEMVKEILEWAKKRNEVLYNINHVKLKAPLLRANMLRDFLAFKGHVEATYRRRGQPIPEEWFKIPIYYKGDPAIFYGHLEEVPWPKYSNHVDIELEIAAIIYKKGKDIDKRKAKDYILGFTIFNDFSARDIQMAEMKGLLGPAKGKDFANGLGPWIVTKDELSDIKGLGVYAKINDEIWCDTRAEDMQWTFEEMIEYVSQDEHIRPGDVFGSGTVSGCTGLDIGKSLKPNSSIELYVEKIGILKNVIVKNQ